MPRIDPLQLLNCLQVLLSPTTGGILSINEVQRLASLMTKFSKKLVSKCVYILILKNTEQQLLGSFMAVGGWTLLQVWLHDAMCNSNWALVKELLELVLITPVDVERLKSNNIPKLVKSLSKREELTGIHELSNKLVQQWLKIVKQETNSDLTSPQINHFQQIQSPFTNQGQKMLFQQQDSKKDRVDSQSQSFEIVELPVVQVDQTMDETMQVLNQDNNITTLIDKPIDTQTFYKLSVRDGKQVLSKVNKSEANYTILENAIIEEVNSEGPKQAGNEKTKEENQDEKKEKSDSKSSSSSKWKDRSKDRDRHKSSSRDKDRSHRDKKDREDKHRRNGESKSSTSSSSSKSKSSSSSSKYKDGKDRKERQAEKDKATLDKVRPQSITKLPKIPKKNSEGVDESKDKDAKKGSISIEVRKNEEKPKTVKVFNAKMRSTGLEEEVRPPPPRPTKKPSTTLPSLPAFPSVQKRTSPSKDVQAVPPEKKSRIEPPERPGSIKLIPPKPKPAVLQESDMFMDALITASVSSKKDSKRRKRRLSTSKESICSPPISPSVTSVPTTPTETSSTNMVLRNIVTPPKFYQDTLETENDEEKKDEDKDDNSKAEESSKEENSEENRSSTPTDPQQEMEVDQDDNKRTDVNGLKGVLVYTKRKGQKKTIRWKSDEELVQIQYFELDETERVNVTKTFGDMAKMDLKCEREALQMSRKLPNEDLMDVQTQWRVPWEIELSKPLAEPGSKSLEKEVQFAREKSVLQALYFHRSMIPDSSTEPDLENYVVKDPIIIPIEAPDDPDQDYRNTPWPEPKGSPPPPNSSQTTPQVFPKVVNSFQNFPNQNVTMPNVPLQQQPQQVPFNGPPGGFIPPIMPPQNPGDWNVPNNPQMMIPPNVPPPDIMNQGPPNMGFVPPPGPMPDNFGHHPPPMFNQPRMFPPNFRGHGDGPHGPHRGGFRRGGTGPWIRMAGPAPGNWRGGHRGAHMPTRLCKNVRQYGNCRNRDSCMFFHPN